MHIPSPPAVLDSVRLRDIQLALPLAPDPWHRQGKQQPATASLKISYSSAVAAAAADDVSLSIDYGKLYRRLDEEIKHMGKREMTGYGMVGRNGSQQQDKMLVNGLAQDVRLIAGAFAKCGLGLLDETAAGVRRMSHDYQNRRRSSASAGSRTQALAAALLSSSLSSSPSSPIDGDYGQCEVLLHLPKALLRAENGLRYRSLTVWGYKQAGEATEEETVIDNGRRLVVLEEEFKIEGIRCYCILGVNSHERVEKQAVIITLEFKGPGQLPWGSMVVDTCQEMTRAVAERVEGTSFQTVEALATFVARIVTVDFANERVTVLVEKPSALAFVARSGIEITRSHTFFDNGEDRTRG